MPTQSLPFTIIETLFPYLVCAARYSTKIQSSIQTLPDKDYDNFFSQALTAADISVQNLVELAMIAHFPEISFFGEEFEKSLNTPYIKQAIWETGEIVVTLDPIDGTRYFIDQHDNYQIILSIMTVAEYLGSILISPRKDKYWFALRGEGAWYGRSLEISPVECQRFSADIPHQPVTLLTLRTRLANEAALTNTTVFDLKESYSSHTPTIMPNDLFTGVMNSIVYNQLNFIDSGVVCFTAKEAGYCVETADSSPLPTPIQLINGTNIPIIVAASQEILQELRKAQPVPR